MPHLGAHAGRDHDGPAAAVGHRRAAPDHVVAVADGHLLGDRLEVLRHRQALPGEGGLRGLERGAADQARVGGDGVAFLQQDEIAGHHVGRGDGPALAVPDHVGVGGRHPAQGGHGFLGARLLHVAQQRVEHDHRQDRDRLVGQRGIALYQPQAGGDRGGDEQQDDQRVLELGEDLAPDRDRSLRGQLVGAVALPPAAGLGLVETALRVGAERGQHRVGRVPVGRVEGRLLAHPRSRSSACARAVTSPGGRPRGCRRPARRRGCDRRCGGGG